MLIISFAWTVPAILAGRKSCTRRDWNESYARKFRKGDIVQAWDKNPRNGGRQIGTIRLTADPYNELLSEAPEADWEAEGFAYLTEIGCTVNGRAPVEFWNGWKASSDKLWVIRFEIVEVFNGTKNL